MILCNLEKQYSYQGSYEVRTLHSRVMRWSWPTLHGSVHCESRSGDFLECNRRSIVLCDARCACMS